MEEPTARAATESEDTSVDELEEIDRQFGLAMLEELGDLTGRLDNLMREIDEVRSEADAKADANLVRQIDDIRGKAESMREEIVGHVGAAVEVAAALPSDFTSAVIELQRRAADVGARVISLTEQYVPLRDWLGRIIDARDTDDAGGLYVAVEEACGLRVVSEVLEGIEAFVSHVALSDSTAGVASIARLRYHVTERGGAEVPSDQPQPQTMTVSEVAQALGIGERTVYSQLHREGHVAGVRPIQGIGRTVRFSRRLLEQAIEHQATSK